MTPIGLRSAWGTGESAIRISGRSIGSRSAAIIVAAALTLSAASLAGRLGPASAEEVKPNFVVVLTDDQRWDTVGRCLGGFDGSDLSAGSDACMPLLQERLMANGTTFLRGHVTTSLCCPSRASILTGQYSRHTGVTQNDDWRPLDDSSTLATWLDQAGYRTGLVGKYLNTYGQRAPGTPPGYVPPGWDSWHAFWGGPDYHRFSIIDKDPGGSATVTAYNSTSNTKPACADDNQYSTDLLCGRALQFLRSDPATPFFLYFAPNAPHAPYTPPGRWKNSYSSLAPPTYPNHNQVPSPDPPAYLPSTSLSEATLATYTTNFRNQLETNRAADDAIGALHQELADQGRLENTVFVFLSDNGFGHGEHRWTGKDCEFEECHRVPFVIACPPSVCPGAAAGRVDSNHEVLNIDLAPTVAELAGATPTHPMDGRSMVPVLNDANASWRSWYTIDDRPSIGPMNGIVSREQDDHTYKYVRGAGSTPRLFDLDADPWELANLNGDGIHDTLASSLSARLDDALTSPVATITSGPSGPTNQVPVGFSWTTNKIASFDCALDGAAAPCGSGTTGSVSYPEIEEGSHMFVLTATDAHNNVSTVSRSFSLDSTPPPPPVLTQTPPDPNEGPATFAFTDEEPNVGFLCSLDLGPLTSCVSPISYTPSAGSHLFEVVAADTAGNRSSSASHAWTQLASDLPPTVTMIKPAADALQTSKLVSASWSGTDETGISRYDVARRIGTAGEQVLVQSGPATSYSFSGLPGTTYCLQVSAFDGSGDVGVGEERCVAVPFDDRSVSITYGGTPTQASVPGSYEGTLTMLNDAGQRAALTFNGRRAGVMVRKDAASGKAQILLDGVLKATLDLYSSRTQQKVYAYNASVPSGVHTLQVVWTGTKNPSSSGTAVGIDGIAVIAVDSIPPDTTIESGPSGTVNTTEATFEFAATEEGSTFACSLDGQAFSICTSPTSYAGLGDGSHTFAVRATDPNGNTDSTSATATWQIDTS